MRLITLIIVALFGLSAPLIAQEDEGYTVAELIAAYEAGQFRILHTRSVWLHASPDGSYVSASSDGVYRISDGAFFKKHSSATFSPDSQYVAVEYDGVYRLSDWQKMFDIGGLPKFSANSQYAAVEGYGVFRLRDGKKLFHIDDSDAYTPDGYYYSFYTHFSPDGSFVAIDKDGVYRLSDQHKLFNITSEALCVTFSHDSTYVALFNDGVYALDSGRKMFDISENASYCGFSSFSKDDNYFIVSGDAIYQMNSGQKLFDIDGGLPTYSPDGEYIAISYDGIYHIETGEKILPIPGDAVFSPNNQYVAASKDGLYKLSDQHKLFEIGGLASIFSEDSMFLVVSGFSSNNGGVYQVRNGEKLFSSPSGATFSPDGQYTAVGRDGFYRLKNTQRLFKIEEINTKFSADGEYIFAPGAVYRVSDGHRYPGLRFLDIDAGIMAVGNTILVVDPTLEDQSFFVGWTYPHYGHGLYAAPDVDSEVLRHINTGEYLAILDEQDGWYQVGYWGELGWIPGYKVSRFAVPGYCVVITVWLRPLR